jgi:hypothetical protein
MEQVLQIHIPQQHVEKTKRLLALYADGSNFQLIINEYFPMNPLPGCVTLNLLIPEKNKLLNWYSLDFFLSDQLPALLGVQVSQQEG